jgi:Ca2+-binding EF-hand superfamily protein
MLPEELNLSGVVSEVISPISFSVSENITASSVQAGQVATERLVVSQESDHIHLAGISANFNKSAPTDELRVAFSVLSKDASSTLAPERVRVIVEFATVDSATDGERAVFEVDLENGLGGPDASQHDFTNNRYVVAKKQLQDLFKTSGFNWGDIEIVKIFITVLSNNAPSSDFYVCLDALRLENVTTQNPLYGMTGYSVVKTQDSQPIIKDLNSSNLAEFRFALEVE